MTMEILNLQQGSNEWHQHRATAYNASDVPSMLACSPYKSRSDFVLERATGITAEVTPAQQRIFDDGHRFEALARPLAEAIIGEELSPCVGKRGKYSASFDGLTFMGDVAFEHKTLGNSLRDAMTLDCTGADLPLHYRAQMEQQAMVSGCERILFMASTWDAEDNLIEERHCWYEPDAELRAQIIAGWEQFEKDVAAYAPPEAAPAPVVGKTPDNLPALLIQVTGAVTASNLPEYKAHALEVFKGINRTLTTDQDFATAESTVKWCADVESRLAAAKEHALSQTATIDELFRTIDDISAEARRTRLELDKLVKARKEEIRGEIVAGGVAALRKHIDELNAAMPADYMPQVPADFAGAIKGKRTVDSLRSAVNDELARAKIEASNIATRIHANVKTLEASGLVVPDAATLVLKAPDDLAAIIATRKAAEDSSLAAIRAEEAEKLQREQLAKQVEQSQKEMIQVAQAGMQAAAKIANVAQLPLGRSAEAAGPAVVPLRTAAPAERTGTPTLKLGTINERLGGVLTISADGLRTLGFEIVARERGACLYHEADFPLMLAALVRHIEGVQEKAAA